MQEVPMESEATETRRFGLADLMILVVATAVGLVPLRNHWDELGVNQVGLNIQIRAVGGWGVAAFEKIGLYTGCISPMLLSLTIAALVLAARRPRPPLRRLVRRPGVVSCLAALAGFAYAATLVLAGYLEHRHVVNLQVGKYQDIWMGWQYLARFAGPQNAGMATLGAWLAALCYGIPRPSADWRDRLGRAMGAGWLLLLLAAYARDLLPHLEKLLR